MTVGCEMSFATVLEHDPFPEMLIRVEGTEGTLELRAAARAARHRPEPEPRAGTWHHRPGRGSTPQYAVAQAAIVPCIADLLADIRGTHQAETTAADNLRTLALVEAAYASAASGEVIGT